MKIFQAHKRRNLKGKRDKSQQTQRSVLFAYTSFGKRISEAHNSGHITDYEREGGSGSSGDDFCRFSTKWERIYSRRRTPTKTRQTREGTPRFLTPNSSQNLKEKNQSSVLQNTSAIRNTLLHL